jgi:hypothetical protein
VPSTIRFDIEAIVCRQVFERPLWGAQHVKLNLYESHLLYNPEMLIDREKFAWGKWVVRRSGRYHCNFFWDGTTITKSCIDNVVIFIWLLASLLSLFADALIGVHCTHGLNRTGYLICKYMVLRMKIDPQEAINSEYISRLCCKMYY